MHNLKLLESIVIEDDDGVRVIPNGSCILEARVDAYEMIKDFVFKQIEESNPEISIKQYNPEEDWDPNIEDDGFHKKQVAKWSIEGKFRANFSVDLDELNRIVNDPNEVESYTTYKHDSDDNGTSDNMLSFVQAYINKYLRDNGIIDFTDDLYKKGDNIRYEDDYAKFDDNCRMSVSRDGNIINVNVDCNVNRWKK